MNFIERCWKKLKHNNINKWVLLILGLCILALVLNHFYKYNPETAPGKFYPYCTFKLATGWECVGCGGQRALHALLHLEVLKALKFNLFYVSIIPVFCYYAWFYFNKIYLKKNIKEGFLFSSYFGYFMIFYIISFTILRNVI